MPQSSATLMMGKARRGILAAPARRPEAGPGHRILILHRRLDELSVLVSLLGAAGYDVQCQRIDASEVSPPADMVPDLLLVQPGTGPGHVVSIPSILMPTEAELAAGGPGMAAYDDILVRPLRPAEVLARVAAILRRLPGRVAARPKAAGQPRPELPDRLVFEAELALRLGMTVPLQAPPGAVLVITLDRIREINTVFGYPAGDVALAEAARRLQACLSPAELIARIGTDTFALALDRIAGPAEAAARGDEMVRRLQTVRSEAGEVLPLGVVAGISLFPADAREPEGLLRRASHALQEARNAGSGQVRLFRPDGQPLQRRVRLSRDLHHAVRRNALTLHYQPQIMLRTGAICGVEALLRWTHPQFGAVPPASFIPLAAEAGLMCAIGRNTLSVACAQAARWQRAGYRPMRMAVNLSPHEFYSESLVQDVATILREADLEPHWLELEITEAMPLDDLAGAIRIMGELKRIGVSLAVDDFGTGWSSLAYLRHFPLDRLKIDRSFTRDVTRAADAAAITRTVIALSGNLDVACLAEGIEDPEQLEWLRSQGCSEGQGYLISRPMAADDVTRLLDLQHGRAAATAGLPAPSG
ncbi:EAL domain-containing protein [Lichenicoccus sp.]|uniref:putative bifunctional diguanylate cyclase/phosphodiesterase n=1 Tax=Lichenicoccus sp. TaxID=2781899 RepID=UPI003D0C7965